MNPPSSRQHCSSIAGFLTIIVFGAVPAFGQAPPQPPVRSILCMPDQFGVVHTPAEFRGDVVVVVYGDRASADANRRLGEQLHVAYHPTAAGMPPAEARRAPVLPVAGPKPAATMPGVPGVPGGAPVPDVRVVPVACIGRVPPLIRPVIQSRFRAGVPDTAVWLDFENQMQPYGVRPGVPNVLLIDPLGRARWHGPAEGPGELPRLTGLIDRLRAETAPGG